MAMEGEPDSGVNDNFDLSRTFSLFIRGQENTSRILNDMRDSLQRSLHMAQSFMTGSGPSSAYQTRQSMNYGAQPNHQAGQTTSQNIGSPQVFNITSLGGPGGPSHVIGPGTAPAGPSPSPRRPTWGLPPVGSTTSAMLQGTKQQTMQGLSRAAFGTWSPYWGQNNQGGGQGGHGGGQGGGGGNWSTGNGGGGYNGGGQSGPGPYGMGPGGMPPNPIYFGGPGSPHGPYGPYGPYGPSGMGTGGTGGDPQGDNRGFNQNNGGGTLYGMNSGVGQWLRRNVPGVNLVDQGFGEVQSQRNKNEYYQNIEGGSNLSGFAERFHEDAYAASTSGVLSSDEARSAFKGVTRLGYNGKVDSQFSQQGGRQDALNFIYHGKTSYGASVNESLQQLEVVSKNSTLSLQGLQKALKDVSDTAGTAGVNAQMARKQLTDLVSQGVSAGYGAGSISTAANIQMGKTSLGRSFETADLSGQMGQAYTYMAASNMGVTYNQYVAMQTNNQLAGAQARAGENLALFSQIFSQQEINWIKQQADGLGGTLDSNAALSLVNKFLTAFPTHNISIIQQQLSSMGVITTDDPQQALAYAFMQIAGNNGDLANAQKNAKDTQPMSTAEANKQANNTIVGMSNGVLKKTGQKTDGNPLLIPDFTTQVNNEDWLHKLTSSTSQGFGGGVTLGSAGDSTAMKNYKNAVAKSNQRNPVLEGLLQQVKDPNSAMVQVHTASGMRVVSLADAIKNHPEELSSGNATFMSGDDTGKSVSDILGPGSVTPGVDWTTEGQKSKDKSGQSLTSWQKAHPDSNAANNGTGTGANGKVIIDLTDAAKQLLKISSQTSGANGDAAPPYNNTNVNATR